MRNRNFRLISLLFAATYAMNLSGAESAQVDVSGIQLAWVLLPSATTPENEAVVAKPKPAKVPTATPAKPPVAKPVQAPVTKSTQVAVAKPAQTPLAKESLPVEWIIGLGMDFGGEELGKLYYTDGSSASVKANNGIAINAGAILANGKNSPFSTQITLGYKFGGPRGEGGDVTWSAIPLEVIEYYRATNLRMGLGISYQIRPQLSVSLPTSNYTDTYNNATGFIAQFGWAPVTEHYSIDLRYTSIKFQLSGVQDAPMVNGSVVGLYTSYRF